MSTTYTLTESFSHSNQDYDEGIDVLSNEKSMSHFNNSGHVHSASLASFDTTSGYDTKTPDRLLSEKHLQPPLPEAVARLERISSQPSIGTPLSNLARTCIISHPPFNLSMLTRSLVSHDNNRAFHERPPPRSCRPTDQPSYISEDAIEAGLPRRPSGQGIPAELPNFAAEVIFVLVCSFGQLFFAWFVGDINVNQIQLSKALGIENTQLPWLVGAFTIANGLSVMLAGSLTDLAPPKFLIVAAFMWLGIWNTVGAFSLTPARAVLFFVVRAMQGLAVGVLVSGSMSILGRVYNPGQRKTRVFSCMAAMAPSGYWLGALQGGALSAHLPWVYGSNAMLCGIMCVAAFFVIPNLKPAADAAGSEAPSIRQFDYMGALFATSGTVSLLFGLTQGSVANWAPYTYALIIVGIVLLAAFLFVEGHVQRPLIPNRLWKTPGCAALMAAYFLGLGSYVAWQFYAIQFWLRIQHVSGLTVALYSTPNLIGGVLATYIVSRLMHVVPGHWIYVCAMVAYALGPAFFIPQTANTTYWALSMPGVALTTFGPDLSFAAASIFITSTVPRSYQGSAGSLLMTVQNLSAAIVTSVSDAIGAQVNPTATGEISLQGLRAIWWFGLGASLLGAIITVLGVRIPKEEEKEHVI